MLHFATYAGQGLGAVKAPVDPLVEAGLNAASAVLGRRDPGAPETFRLLKRIIAAPGFFPKKTSSGAYAEKKISDLNPYLRTAANVMENPILTVVGLAMIPILAFALGRASKRPRS